MKYLKRDRNFREWLQFTAKETGLPISEVEEAVDIYFRTMSQIIEWDNPVSIHVDYIGDLIFNQKWRDKVKEIADGRLNNKS